MKKLFIILGVVIAAAGCGEESQTKITLEPNICEKKIIQTYENSTDTISCKEHKQIKSITYQNSSGFNKSVTTTLSGKLLRQYFYYQDEALALIIYSKAHRIEEIIYNLLTSSSRSDTSSNLEEYSISFKFDKIGHVSEEVYGITWEEMREDEFGDPTITVTSYKPNPFIVDSLGTRLVK